MLQFYKYKYYLNASHSFDNKEEHKHTHTFAITLSIEEKWEGFITFLSVDQRISEYFEQYAGKYLNEMITDPSLENLGEFFYENLKKLLYKDNFNLIQLEIMENPVRSYFISDRLLIGSNRISDNSLRWQKILTQKERLLSVKAFVKEENNEK